MPEPDADISGRVVDATPDSDKAAPVALTEPVNERRAAEADEMDRALRDMPGAAPADDPPMPRPAPQPAPRRRRGGFMALVLGGALAAAGGFALARYIPGGWPVADTSALEARIAGVEERMSALDAEIAGLPIPAAPDADLASRVAALETAEPAPAPVVDLTPLEARLAALEAGAPVASDVTAPATGQAAPPAAPPAAIAALEARIAAVEASVANGSTGNSAATAEIERLVATATDRIAEAEARAEALRTQTDAATRNAALRAALGRLQAALETGAPFASAIAEMSEAGVEVPPELTASAEEGIPTLAALQAAFPDAARAALAASTRATMGDGMAERVTAFLRTQTGARSLTPREGAEPDAILSRAEAALRTGNLATVMTEIGALPPEGQAALADWVALATRRVQATDSATALTAALDAG